MGISGDAKPREKQWLCFSLYPPLKISGDVCVVSSVGIGAWNTRSRLLARHICPAQPQVNVPQPSVPHSTMHNNPQRLEYRVRIMEYAPLEFVRYFAKGLRSVDSILRGRAFIRHSKLNWRIVTKKGTALLFSHTVLAIRTVTSCITAWHHRLLWWVRVLHRIIPYSTTVRQFSWWITHCLPVPRLQFLHAIPHSRRRWASVYRNNHFDTSVKP